MLGQTFPQAGIRPVVERRKAVVEEECAGVAGKRTGNGETLPLTARHVRPSLGNLCLEPFGAAFHELARLGDIARQGDLLCIHGFVGVGDIAPDGSGEKKRLLWHVAELRSQVALRETAHVHAV